MADLKRFRIEFCDSRFVPALVRRAPCPHHASTRANCPKCRSLSRWLYSAQHRHRAESATLKRKASLLFHTNNPENFHDIAWNANVVQTTTIQIDCFTKFQMANGGIVNNNGICTHILIWKYFWKWTAWWLAGEVLELRMRWAQLRCWWSFSINSRAVECLEHPPWIAQNYQIRSKLAINWAQQR